MLTYKGEVTFRLIDSILKIIECKLNSMEDDLKTRKKVYNVLSESLRNLCFHTEIKEEYNKIEEPGVSNMSLLLIESSKEGYKVGTGNFISKDKKENLKHWLDQINSFDKNELRDVYKEILNNDQFTEKGGGGLGLLDIARKSGQKLQYKFDEVNEQYAFFSFQIEIPRHLKYKNYN